MATQAQLKETAMWLTRIGFALMLIAGTAGCRKNPTIKEANKRPIADARLNVNGDLINEETLGADGMPGSGLKLEFTGTPITITIDGSLSSDEDGKIATYRWLSGTIVPDGGVPVGSTTTILVTKKEDGTKEMATVDVPLTEQRWFPEGADGAWPGDDKSVMLDLPGEGIYTFNLWVIDDDGAISKPDAITITVAMPFDPNMVPPEVTECAANVLESVDPACATCLCAASADCRAAVVETACNADCWGLIQCIGAMCPDFMPGGDTSCVVGMCADFLGGATPAGPVGACIRMCPDECTAD